MKKTSPVIFLMISLLLIIPVSVFADGSYSASTEDGDPQTVNYEGMVPCGKCVNFDPGVKSDDFDGGIDDPLWTNFHQLSKKRCGASNIPVERGIINCQFCHFFIMLDGIIDFVLLNIVPPLAVLMIVIGAVMFFFAGANPNMLKKGKGVIKSVLIGLILIYGSYLIIGLFLNVLGVTQWSTLSDWVNPSQGVFSINCPVIVK